MRTGAHPWRATGSGVRLLARVTARSACDDVGGLTETPAGRALEVRVRAVAAEGEANRAVEKTVADWLGVAKSRVRIAQGGKSRVKTLAIDGEPGALVAALAARLDETQ